MCNNQPDTSSCLLACCIKLTPLRTVEVPLTNSHVHVCDLNIDKQARHKTYVMEVSFSNLGRAVQPQGEYCRKLQPAVMSYYGRCC